MMRTQPSLRPPRPAKLAPEARTIKPRLRLKLASVPRREASGRSSRCCSPRFPEISISKIRFLEAEGLITPQRAPSGYRRYTEGDVERLRYVLSVQRQHYLPLEGDPGASRSD